MPPTLTAEERAEIEAASARPAPSAGRSRCGATSNLLARYPNEAAHRKAREAALDTVRLAIKATESA
jgi:hypothetical protein